MNENKITPEEEKIVKKDINKSNKRTFGYYVGSALGAVILSCLAVCVASIAIALTIKLVIWMF